MPELLDLWFRPSPRLRLARLEQLAERERDTLRDLGRDPDFYGVLLPVDGSPQVPKAVSRDTALLLLSLGDGAPIPAYHRHGRPRVEAEIQAMLDDGVLEVRHGGRFLSSVEAATELDWLSWPEVGDDAISRLTLEAIRWGERLEIADASALSARLYFFNRLPVTPEVRLQYRAERKVRNVLGVGQGGELADLLAHRWREVRLTPPNDGWLMWQLAAGPRLDAEAHSIFKLYVSPMLVDLPAVFVAAVHTFTELGVPRFKVGRDAHGLLRPDKIVAYFPDEEAMRQAASALALRIAGATAHGVPFSSPTGDDSLISWGVDPPKAGKLLGWQETETWRSWLTNRVAVALLQARSEAASAGTGWKFALRRLDRLGVELTNWRPRQGFLASGESAAETAVEGAAIASGKLAS